MTYQQHSVLVEETDFLAEVPADATVAHLSSFFFSSAVAAEMTAAAANSPESVTAKDEA